MENFKVEDMKVGDSFEWKSLADIKYTTTKVSDKHYETSWEGDHCLQETYGAVLNYTKLENFKLLKVNFKNTFTKSDLISGEHIVELCNGKRYLVAGEYLISDSGYMMLSDYNDLLEKENKYYNIDKVFCGKDFNGRLAAGMGLGEYLRDDDLKLIYDREENEHRASQQAKLRSLEESIVEQQKKAEKLREELGL